MAPDVEFLAIETETGDAELHTVLKSREMTWPI